MSGEITRQLRVRARWRGDWGSSQAPGERPRSWCKFWRGVVRKLTKVYRHRPGLYERAIAKLTWRSGGRMHHAVQAIWSWARRRGTPLVRRPTPDDDAWRTRARVLWEQRRRKRG